MALTQPPTPDNTTQVLGLLVAALTLGAAVVNRFPIGKKKKDTGEHTALKLISKKDDAIADLERRLGIRDDEVKKMQDELALLRPLRDEIEVVRNANAGLAAYNQQLTKEINDLRGRMDLS